MVLLFNIHFITIMPVIICGLLTIKKEWNNSKHYREL